MDRGQREVLVIEVGCPYDLYMDHADNTELMKYQSLYQASCIRNRYKATVTLGSLGHVHQQAARGPQLAGLPKSK